MSSTKSRGTLAVVLAAFAGILILALPAAASARDRNHDKIPDKWEKHYNLSLKVNQAHRNQDGDKLRNRQEFRAGTSPRNADTNGDGTEDGDGAGTIASFDSTTGTLVINQFDGSTLSGQVTDQTEIQCENDQGDTGDTGDTGDGDGDNGDTGDNGGTGGGGDDKVARSDGGGDTGGGDEGSCSTADLVPGAVVSEAQLDDTGTTFESVDLGSTGDED
jgi:hypothetical protein